MNDFVNGLTSVNDYLNRTTIELPTSVTADLTSGTIITSTTGFNLKEIICSLLAGNGIKLPNLQMCLKINLDRILNIDAITGPLRNALRAASEALEAFIAHTNIDNVLARLNAAIAEFAAIANMINFCGTPVLPRAIPNVLRDTMGSFLGRGEELLNRLGTIIPSEIGGCIGLGGGVNPDIFTGGILKDLSHWLDDVQSMPQDVLDSFVTELNGFSSDIRNLVEFENNFKSTEVKGGSTFQAQQSLHTGVGMAIDPNAMTFAESQRLASNIKGLYDSLSAYEVDDQGRNIFDYLLEPSLIDKLKNEEWKYDAQKTSYMISHELFNNEDKDQNRKALFGKQKRFPGQDDDGNYFKAIRTARIPLHIFEKPEEVKETIKIESQKNIV